MRADWLVLAHSHFLIYNAHFSHKRVLYTFQNQFQFLHFPCREEKVTVHYSFWYLWYKLVQLANLVSKCKQQQLQLANVTRAKNKSKLRAISPEMYMKALMHEDGFFLVIENLPCIRKTEKFVQIISVIVDALYQSMIWLLFYSCSLCLCL